MTEKPPRTPIPMVVIGGYLGTGKTTVLNRLLTDTQGRRVAVLVNDFGEINIDAAMIRARSDDVIQLENGCVCCSIGDKLVQALADIGEREERPDLLVIEASGVSDPMRIAQVGMLDSAYRLNAIVVTADVSRLGENLNDPLVGDMVRQQLSAATAVILTKCDLVSEEGVLESTEVVKRMASRAAIFRAEHGAIPLSVFVDVPPVEATPQPRGSNLTAHDGRWKKQSMNASLHSSITSFAYRTTGRFHKQQLRQVLRELPAGTLRAKGIVQVHGKERAQEFHVVGGRVRVGDAEVTVMADTAEASESVLVFIGCLTAADEAQVRSSLDAARH